MKKFSVVIVGGGTAGWMTAAALANQLNKNGYDITLIESEQIGTVGVGEATVPHLRYFNQMLGLDENEFMRRTNATYKLGIEFIDWGKKNSRYLHPFGIFGKSINGVAFHHCWLKAKGMGFSREIFDYSVGVVAAKNNKFSYPIDDHTSLASKFSYAFHMDANLYATLLRKYAEGLGVKRLEGKVDTVAKNLSGNIQTVIMEGGTSVSGELFIDCSGFRGLLIEDTLDTGYDDWSHWLPCNKAVAVPSEKVCEAVPYTKSTATAAGWRWQIPLQSRTGNGHVYCSDYISDDEAAHILLNTLDGEPLANLNFLKFKAGRRKKSWNKNCVAIGLSGGFLEPLESTSIYLIQVGITKLLEYFPGVDDSTHLSEEYNREIYTEYERIRDFIILHYVATERDDTDFWKYVKGMDQPESLRRKIALFMESGQVENYKKGMFLEPSWLAVYFGQGIFPEAYNPMADLISKNDLEKHLIDIQEEISFLVNNMPSHSESIIRNIALDKPVGLWPPASLSLYGVFS